MIWEAKAEARRKVASEDGTITKDWGGRIPVALIYPNTYFIGMSNLGLQAIYALLNADDRIVCERAFWEGQTMDGAGQPALALESGRELREFSVLAFTLTFEMDYFNVVAVLRQAKVPLLASERDERDPLVIAGGPCAIQNPEPLAPFFDAIAIGEGEVIVPHLVEVLEQSADLDRETLLRRLASIPGMYVPSLYSVTYHADGTIANIAPDPTLPPEFFPVKRQHVASLEEYPVHSVVLTRETELGDMYLVEVSRGCTRGCQFCLAGFVFLPIRERKLDDILAVAQEGLRFRKRIGLVGAATTDYSRIGELARRLREMGALVSVSSLRIDSLSNDLLKALVESGTKTITLAPEAGSQRLRQVINKRISEEQIDAAIDLVGKWQIAKLKLYFMIGLPSETNEDIEAIIELTRRIKRRLAKQRPGAQITLTVSPFIPKAQTPFQHESMMAVRDLKERMASIKRALMREGVTVRTDSAEWAEVQAVLARGDRRLARVLQRMRRSSLSEWRRALADEGLSVDFYARRVRPAHDILPWALIRSGVKADYLPVAKRPKRALLRKAV